MLVDNEAAALTTLMANWDRSIYYIMKCKKEIIKL